MRIFSILMLSLLSHITFSQDVDIPDVNFLNALIQQTYQTLLELISS